MKMKKLTSITNPMSEEEMHQAPSLDEEVADKISGFAKYASPKKGTKNGFAQFMIEAKQEIGINVGGDKSGFAKNNFLVKNRKKRSRPASASNEKANIAKMRKFRSPTESIPAKSAAHVTKPGQHNSTQCVERVSTKPASAGDEDGYAPISQAKMRKFKSPTESIPAKSAAHTTTKSGQHNSTQCAERVPTKPASAGDEDGYAPISQAKMRRLRYERLEPTGYNWKSISKETRDVYFEEFKKYFVWRQSDAVIYQGWLANARKKYSELCSVTRSAWEKHERPDKRISMEVYLSWSEFWKTPTFQKKSEIQKNNRSSGVDGCLSTHTSGSASHRTIAARAQMKYQCDPTADQIFLITHLKNPNVKKIMCGEDDEDEENGENCNDERIWVDKKSQLTYEKFERLYEEQVKAGLPVDKNALFLEAAGGFDKKKRVYGVGSSQDLFYRPETVPCSSSFTNVENHKLREELKAVKDKMNTIENQIAKILEINSFQRAQSPTTDVDDVGQNGDE